MTKNSPRIYIYKITFEEVQYYYYGVHKERRYNEYYMGSPVTHKWMWKFYTPKKQILQFFEFSDAGYIEAQEVEKRIIEPFYQTDKWCLNENCGGKISLDVLRKNVQKNKINNISIFSLTKEQLSENGKIGAERCKELGVGIYGINTERRIEIGKNNYEMGVGIHALNSEQKSQAGKLGGTKSYELSVGVHSFSREQRSENGKKSKQMGVGIHAQTKEQLSENGKKNGNKVKELKLGICGLTTEERRENVKITNSQRWECCETGYVSTAAGVVAYQKHRGIDTSKSNRRRIS